MPKKKWLLVSSERVRTLVVTYEGNLQQIADAMTVQADLDVVCVRHVDLAHDALAAAGLCIVPWYKRSQFKTSIAGFLIGAGFSAMQLVPLTSLPSDWVTPASWCVLLLLSGIGVILGVWGWLEHSW